MQNFLKYFLFINCFFPVNSISQNQTIDSLQLLLKKSKEDTIRLNYLLELSYEYQNIHFDSANKYASAALDLSKKINYKKGKAKALYALGYIYIGNDNEIALTFLNQSLGIMKKCNMKKDISSVLSDIGYIYMHQGLNDTALNYFWLAKKIDEEMQNKEGIAYAFNNIGTVYYHQGRIEKALDFFHKALAIREELGKKSNIANSFNNIGTIYIKQGQIEKAIECFQKALNMLENESVNTDMGMMATILTNLGVLCQRTKKYQQGVEYMKRAIDINTKLENKSGLAYCYNSLGALYGHMGNKEKAMEYYFKSYEIANELGQKRTMSQALEDISQIYKIRGDLDNALKYASKALTLAQEIKYPEQIDAAARELSNIYAKKKIFEKAYQYAILSSQMHDSIINMENTKQIAEMQTKYETEKKDKEILMLNKERQIKELDLARKDSDIHRQRMIIWSAVGGIFLLTVLAFFIYRGYREKKRANEIITAQKSEVEYQKYIIEVKNKDITDSINYAQRIQSAILPEWEEVKKYFPESFVLYKPRDIISGDFYWFAEKQNHVMLAACDCTGHGVPGALMSMIGNSLLHQITNEKIINNPSSILHELDKELSKALHQHGVEGESHDGMDMAFIEIDKPKSVLRYAGANRPIYIVRNKELFEISPDKYPIGGYGLEKKFNTKMESLFTGDVLYLFSDGYADQFGGTDGKKFMTKNLKKLFVSIHDKPISEQKVVIEKTFGNWKADREQLDDVLVIGLKI